MIDKLKGEIIRFLRQHDMAYLSLSSPDGPWAAMVHYLNDGLTLYLNEMSADDLVFFIEHNPAVVLTVAKTEFEGTGAPPGDSVQIFGQAQILTPDELKSRPAQIQAAIDEKNRQLPGVFVAIEIIPLRIYRVVRKNGSYRREALDIEQSP